MLALPSSVKVHLAASPVDMRKSIDGLFALVQQQLQQDPYAGHLFVFLSKRGDRLKVLFWDQGGFALYYKRQEKGRFKPPPGLRMVLNTHQHHPQSRLDELLPAAWARARAQEARPAVANTG